MRGVHLQINKNVERVESMFDFWDVSKRSWKYEMNGFVGVTDNDWFAFLSQQPGIDVLNSLPKTAIKKT